MVRATRFFVLLVLLATSLHVLAEEAVLVHFPLSNSHMGSSEDLQVIFALEQKLSTAITSAGAGEFDGNDIGQGECILYMYGPSANRLFEVVRPVLEESSLAKRGFVRIRLGPPGSKETRVQLGQ